MLLHFAVKMGICLFCQKDVVKCPLFWNYLVKCICFEIQFLENWVSMKNSIWWKSSFNEKLDLMKIE